MASHVILPYCLAVYALLAVTPPPPPPPPYFREKLLYRVILPPLHAPPRGPLEPVCGTAVLARVASVEELYLCIKHASV